MYRSWPNVEEKSTPTSTEWNNALMRNHIQPSSCIIFRLCFIHIAIFVVTVKSPKLADTVMYLHLISFKSHKLAVNTVTCTSTSYIGEQTYLRYGSISDTESNFLLASNWSWTLEINLMGDLNFVTSLHDYTHCNYYNCSWSCNPDPHSMEHWILPERT